MMVAARQLHDEARKWSSKVCYRRSRAVGCQGEANTGGLILMISFIYLNLITFINDDFRYRINMHHVSSL